MSGMRVTVRFLLPSLCRHSGIICRHQGRNARDGTGQTLIVGSDGFELPVFRTNRDPMHESVAAISLPRRMQHPSV